MENTSEKTFSFGDFELDAGKRQLLKQGEIIALNSKSFDLLLVLVENHERILTKDELLEKVWEGQFVEENNLTVHISALRKIFGEKKGEHQFIITIPGKGYRFIANVRISSNGKNSEQDLVTGARPVQENLNYYPEPSAAADEGLIGRNGEIAEIKSLLKQSGNCLVTLTGAGGSGKTRLAQAVATQLKPDFPDGIFFVELATVNTPEFVASAVAQALGIRESDSKSKIEKIKEFLRERQSLLVLDNFEQVLPAAMFVKGIMAESVSLKILVTSRVALHIQDEREFRVLPLDLPPENTSFSVGKLAEYSAIALFGQRARDVKPGFTLTNENAAAVTGICRRLNGLPLAIELAAARVRLLPPQAILDRLGNSLKLLTGGTMNYPSRQQTMREAIYWSYDLLSEDEQIVFRRLAVFAGEFSVKAAEAILEETNLKSSKVSSSVLDLLDSLVSSNLIISKELADGNVRLRYLEVVREFALECLEKSGEAETVRRVHSVFFLALAEKADPHLVTGESAYWIAKLEIENDNLRAALRWLLEQESEMAARMAAALRHFWAIRSYLTEARSWLETTLEKSSKTPSEIRLKLLNALSIMARNQGDYRAARKAVEESLAVSRTLNDLSQIILSCHAVAGLEVREGNFEAAQMLLEEALKISRELSDEKQISYTLASLGDLLLAEGQASAARRLIEESLEISRRLGFKANTSINLINLGTVAYFEDDAETTRLYFAECIKMAQDMGNKVNILCCLDGFAAFAVLRENYEQAALLAGAAESLREALSYEREIAECLFRDSYISKLRRLLDKKVFDDAYQKGRELNLNEAVALAESMTFVPLGQTAEIIIETHKFERFRIEEEIEEKRKMPVVVNPILPAVSSNLSWLKRNSVRLFGSILLLAAIGGFIWLNGPARSGTSIPFANSSVKRLTTNGKVGLAALSPDGKLFAYTINDLGQRSLRIGYVDGGNHLQLRPAEANAAYFGLAFAPDSNQIYFSYKDDKTPAAALYRMHVSGGVQEKIAEAVENFSLSSDGKQIAFVQREGEKDLLFVANLDGTNSREIASFPKTESLVFDSVSWSPDNKQLAFSKLRDNLTGEQDLAIVEISNSKIESFKDDSLRDIAKTAWLKNGSGIIVSALKTDSQASVLYYNIFLVEIPGGKIHEVTGDLSSYVSSLNLSQNSNAILTIEHRQLNNIWIAPADNLSAARQITFGSFGKYDGLWGMDFTPDGKIIYTNSDTKSQFISEINVDGSGSKPLTTPGKVDSVLNVSNDGRYIVFHSTRGGSGMDIWRMDFDGGNPKQLTFGGRNFQPFVSTDNRWVYYKSWEKDTGELRRVSIDGSEPEIINENETSWLSFSPDGKYFAASYKTDQYRLAVFDAATNKVVKQFEIPKGGTLGMGSHWSPDSLSIIYRDNNFGYWQQNIEGGEPQRLEGLPKEKFYNFTFSKDGKWFAFVRGQEIRDVVMIDDLK